MTWLQDRGNELASWPRTTMATLAAAAMSANIAAGELDRLLGNSLTEDGQVATLKGVLGPGGLGARSAWLTWDDVPSPNHLVRWIVLSALLNAVVTLGVAALLLRWLRSSNLATRLVGSWVVLRLASTVLVVGNGLVLGQGRVWGAVTGLLGVVSLLAWLALPIIVVTCLRSAALREQLGPGIGRSLTAVRYQRLSMVPVALLGLLSCLPGPNILDQLPDVERAWVDGWTGLRQGAAALIAVLLVAALLFVLGRRRSRRAERSLGVTPTVPAEVAGFGVWLVGPVLVLLGAAALAARSAPDLVDPVLVGLFVGIPALLLVVSYVIRLKGSSVWSETASATDLPQVVLIRRVGDGLALALVLALALGLVRSYTAPVLDGASSGDERWKVALLLLGFVGSWVVFPVGRALQRWVEELGAGDSAVGNLVGPLARPTEEATWPDVAGRVGAALVATAMAVMVVFAVPVSRSLGVVAVVVLALGGWSALLGFLIVHLQDRQPLEAFRLLHLRAAPVLTLFLAVPVAATVFPAAPALHYVRTLSDAPAKPQQLLLSDVFTAWLGADPSTCAVTVGGVKVRPLLLAAASGGGIRSAVWTSSALTELAKAGSCGSGVTLLSSGVSGGSVGLALSHVVTGDQTPLDAALRLAKPAALSAALSGTLVGDLVAGSTGLRVPPEVDGDADGHWLDRAGLMERAWEHQVPPLAGAWDMRVAGPGGALVLNSTAVGYGCRMLVSQVDLSVGEHTGSPANCRTRSGEPAAALDLVQVYGDCTPHLAWSTAAMFSARFPTVTPAGRIPLKGACEGLPDVQLVDGGYAESSGVGTLADVAPAVVSLIRDYNALADGASKPFVVPLVAYFEDEVRSDVRPPDPGDAPEALVPLAGAKASKTQKSTPAQLQRVALVLRNGCPASVPACGLAFAGVRDRIPDGVLLVAPRTAPSVSAPLGWTLSNDSIVQLRRAMDEQVAQISPRTGAYAPLGSLLALLRGD